MIQSFSKCHKGLQLVGLLPEGWGSGSGGGSHGSDPDDRSIKILIHQNVHQLYKTKS